MKCIDEVDTTIFGNYNSDKASNMMIVFDRCDRTLRTCKSETMIDAWLEFNYIVALEHTKRFI